MHLPLLISLAHALKPSAIPRRALLASPALLLPTSVLANNGIELSGPKEDLPGTRSRDYGKSEMTGDGFTRSSSGLQLKDAKTGTGSQPSNGDRVVIQWEGYTIGYFGRPFEKASGPKGGAFENGEEREFTRFTLGQGTVIPGLEEGVRSMREGGVRQLIIPPSLSYPDADPEHTSVGPKPSTFSGQRALNFVLFNKDLVDKTLLMNVKVIRVDKRGERGFSG